MGIYSPYIIFCFYSNLELCIQQSQLLIQKAVLLSSNPSMPYQHLHHNYLWGFCSPLLKHFNALSKLFIYATISAIFNISIAVFFSLPIWLLLSSCFNSTREGTAHCLFFTITCVCELHPVAINSINSIITFIFSNNFIFFTF